MKESKTCPKCYRGDCFGCEGEHCIILTKNNFGNRECPFFKTEEQVEKEKAYCKERLENLKKDEE